MNLSGMGPLVCVLLCLHGDGYEDDGRDCAAGEIGMIVIHDLANIGSISAIETADLGRRVEDGFEVLGRQVGAEERGCSIAADIMLGTSERS